MRDLPDHPNMEFVSRKRREILIDAMNELKARRLRIAALETAIRAMHAAVPGGQICDTQRVADDLRAIADRVGVSIPD